MYSISPLKPLNLKQIFNLKPQTRILSNGLITNNIIEKLNSEGLLPNIDNRVPDKDNREKDKEAEDYCEYLCVEFDIGINIASYLGEQHFDDVIKCKWVQIFEGVLNLLEFHFICELLKFITTCSYNWRNLEA